MSPSEKQTLEDFALKGMSLAKMTGVSTATHAVGDGFLLMHTGVGCKYKAAAQVSQHDWIRHPNRREAWTQVGEISLIKGSAARIGPFARTWYERRRPGFMVVVSAYFIELTGDDLKAVVAETEATLPCPMLPVATAAPNKGFFDGYAEVLLGMAARLDWTQPATKPTLATVMGFFFHRYEPDQQADMNAMAAMIEAAGLQPGPVWLSGEPWATLETSAEAEVVITLPYVRVHKRKVRKLFKKRTTVDVDLPLGMGATRRFVRSLCAAGGGDAAAAEAWLDAQHAAIQPLLGGLIQGFGDVRVAVFADGPLAAGLVSLLRELGVQVPLVGLRDRATGGKAAFYDTVGKNGVHLAEDVEVWLEPSLRKMRDKILDMAEARELHLVIGSSIELDALTRVQRAKGALEHVALLETGFPSKDVHATLPLPSFGPQGLLVWAQRIVEGVLGPRLGTRVQG